jgi:hypothetical protein
MAGAELLPAEKKSGRVDPMRCNVVASLRATAIRAFAMPRRLAIFIPHARNAGRFWLRIKSECAASQSATS